LKLPCFTIKLKIKKDGDLYNDRFRKKTESKRI
jgi:hypothetical protein